MQRIGFVLAELRRQYGKLSQMKVAELANLDHSYISRIETGTRQPSRESLIAISEAMELASADEARLLIAGGFMPRDLSWLYRHPAIAQLDRLREALESTESAATLDTLISVALDWGQSQATAQRARRSGGVVVSHVAD